MPYDARVLEVMIASPSDVTTERGVIRSVLAEWNDLNAKRTGVVLLPVGWETHAVPQMGSRAQEIINRDVLARCDLLVAVFWTRLGSPTGAAPSGTVEEINEHVAAGKPAMVYFSEAPVRLDSVDDEQYRALREFRKECEANGLVETFDSTSDLRDKFSRQLSRVVHDRFVPEVTGGLDWGRVAGSARMPDLSREAKELLKAVSQDPNGEILYLKVFGGPVIQINGVQINDPSNSREQARWDRALRELTELGLIEPQGAKHEIYRLTAEGYEVADRLSES